MLNRLERVFGRLAIPNISLYIVIGQVFVLLAFLCGMLDLSNFMLIPTLVKQGEWWRLITFIFYPPPPGMFGWALVAFSWYMFFLMGSALEHFWGAFRYNLFLLTGYLFTVAVAFITPGSFATNLFIAGSVFLAFAWLNPDFEIMLFFIIPVKIKYLALFTWVMNAVLCFVGTWPTRLQVLASVVNFLLFFAGDIIATMRHRRRKMETQARRFAAQNDGPAVRHRCHVCGKTDVTNPEMDFRYCSKCAGDQCYCPEHIFNHEHVLTDGKTGKS